MYPTKLFPSAAQQWHDKYNFISSAISYGANVISYHTHTHMHTYFNYAHSSTLASQPYSASVWCVLELQHANVDAPGRTQKGSSLL